MDGESDQAKRWTEEETLLALYLYFQLPFGQLHSRNPEIQKLATALGRSDNSIAMKLCNFASLDPKIVGSGRKGLTGASKLDRAVYDEFGQDWTSLVDRAENVWANRVERDVSDPKALKEDRREFSSGNYNGPSTRKAFADQRIGQNFFRRAVLANFEEACCITGIADPRLLTASHIKPWARDEFNRHNPANGLLLSATFDKAFDRGLITVDENRRINVSRQLRESESEATRYYFRDFEGKLLRSAVRFDPDPAFLRWHNLNCFVDRSIV